MYKEKEKKRGMKQNGLITEGNKNRKKSKWEKEDRGAERSNKRKIKGEQEDRAASGNEKRKKCKREQENK